MLSVASCYIKPGLALPAMQALPTVCDFPIMSTSLENLFGPSPYYIPLPKLSYSQHMPSHCGQEETLPLPQET